MQKMKVFLCLFMVTAVVFSTGTMALGYSSLAEADLTPMVTKLETAVYKAYGADGDTVISAKAKAEEIVAKLLTGSGITATVNDSINAPAFKAATTVDSPVQPNVDGYYKFTVTLSSDGETTLNTKELKMTIIPDIDGCVLRETIEYLVNDIGPRISGTISEQRACEYMKEVFEKIDGGDNVYDISLEEYLYSWVPARGIQLSPTRTQYGYLVMNARQQYGVVEADVPSGAAAIGNPYPNSASFRDFAGGLFHDFGTFNASNNRVSSTPAESDVIAAGGKIYGTLRFDRTVTGTMINNAIANIKAAYSFTVDVTGLFVARIDNAKTTTNLFSYTYNDVPVTISSYSTATTSVIGLTLADVEKCKKAGEAGIITKVYRADPEIGRLTRARKPAADADNPDLVIVYTSHIDTVRGAPGATDTATGVSALAELARRFKNVDTGNIELIFAAQGAEEYNDFSATSYMIEKLRAEGKDVITVNMNFDTPASFDNAVNVLGDPIDTFILGTIQYETRYQYPNYRNALYGVNLGRETSMFNLSAHLLSSFATEVDWPLDIKNVRINNWGASDHAMWSYFGIDSCGPRSAARGGNFSMSDANNQVYRYQYHSSLDDLSDYNYDSHLKTTNLLANGIKKAIDLEVTKRAKFLFDEKEGTVTLYNASQLFKTYEAVSGTFSSSAGNIPFKFTPENTVIELANANDYIITNLIATGTGIGNHQDVATKGEYKEFSTGLAPMIIYYSEPEGPITLSVADIQAAPGDTVELAYTITDNDYGFTHWEVELPFDSAIFAPVDVTLGALADGATLDYTINGNVLYVDITCATAIIGDGKLFTVTYAVAATAPYIFSTPLQAKVNVCEYSFMIGIKVAIPVIVEPGMLKTKLAKLMPTAVVKKLNGNKNDLTITVVAIYEDGSQDVFCKTFSINNNSADYYDVNGYTVYVDTKGNDQIRACYIDQYQTAKK
ncbi:MAG: M28 family peptidase [Firmicutes bacterium]|nr:M28 family peptidase [Bacillota bacterium]